MRRALIAVLAGSFLALPALAQDTDTQQMAARNIAMPGDAESIRFVQAFGLCAARDANNQSRIVLRSLPGSAASDRALFGTATVSVSCVKYGDALKYSPSSLRGPVAEYFLKRDFDPASWKPKNRSLALYESPDSEKLARLPADIRANIVMVEIGSCVAKADPTGVAALFAASVTSAEERAAFAKLSSALSTCLPPAVELKMSKFLLRGILAEGTYRAAAAAAKGAN